MVAAKPEATHCVHGHKWTPENTYSYLGPNGQKRRKCKQCVMNRDNKRRDRSHIHRKRKVRPKDAKDNDATECMRVNRIAHLIDLLWQASTPWQREDLQAEIRALRPRDKS